MSEKRFKQSDPNIAIHSSIVIVWDSEKHCHMNQEKIIDLLNSLSDENEQLKYDNFMFKGVIKTFQKVAISERKKLEKENERLRQILKDIVGATDETYMKNKSIYKVTVIFDNKGYLKIRECLNE